jgi:RecA-family ATPase
LLQLAVGVSSGIPVAGHWQVGETGSVLVFCAEDDEDEIHRRLSRIRNYLFWSGNVGQLAGIEKRLFVFSTIGTDTLLTKRQATGEVVATDVTSRIMAMARHLNDLRLIVIDPASRFRGGDENKNEDATRFVEALEALAKQTGASVLIAHHASKASLSPDSDPSQGASRGASALTDGLRWQMNLNKPNNSQVKKWAIPAEDHRNHVVGNCH